ncbi:MAG: fimbrillin family protein [Paludibacteraceae bacterium]|nr:fimbrillin family protein [Paludibacteraceae bacterium]
MKRLSFMAMSALLALGVASCKKNADVQNPESKEGMVKTEFSAVSKESKEKTSISGGNILWSSGDIVKIYAGASTSGSDFTLTEGDGTTSATFEGWISAEATAPYYAVYPSSAAQGIDGSAIKYSIPAEQAYVENSFATGTVPMVAYSEADKSLAFKNQTAFIKLELTGEGTIATMEIASAANNICGTFSVSKADPTASSTAVAGANKITVTNIDGTALDATTPKNVIIAVAPATFATDDITLSMTDSDGKVFSTKIGGFNVERSGGKAVAVEVEFETPASEVNEISEKDGSWKDPSSEVKEIKQKNGVWE